MGQSNIHEAITSSDNKHHFGHAGRRAHQNCHCVAVASSTNDDDLRTLYCTLRAMSGSATTTNILLPMYTWDAAEQQGLL